MFGKYTYNENENKNMVNCGAFVGLRLLCARARAARDAAPRHDRMTLLDGGDRRGGGRLPAGAAGVLHLTCAPAMELSSHFYLLIRYRALPLYLL